MALGIVDSAGSGSGGGDFTPIVKWDAKGGDFTARNRAQTAAGVWENDDVDVQMPVKLIADLETYRGWLGCVCAHTELCDDQDWRRDASQAE
jgi:hypothetical protein